MVCTTMSWLRRKIFVIWATLSIATTSTSGIGTVALFKPKTIMDTKWNSELVTDSYNDIETFFVCGGICQRDPRCRGWYYDSDTGECHLSTKVYKWLLDSAGSKSIYMRITSDYLADQKITKIGMQTGPSLYDDCVCDLITKVCVNGNCCLGRSGHEANDLDELVILEGSSLGTCQDFVVPDYRQAEVYIYQAVQNDGWDGTHVDIWFNVENTWRIRCQKVGGGEIILTVVPQLLECNFME